MDPIVIKIRHAAPPHDEYEVVAHLPFEVFGEKFAVTAVQSERPGWRATHIETGSAIPGTICFEMSAVPGHTARVLAEVGEAKLKAAIANTKELISQ